MMFDKLAAPFPPEAIHWRSQTLTRDKTKALALAYLDARDVMDRLDAVAGPENWQDRYEETATGRVICTISIRVGDHWVSKSDGAGKTAVEADKGGISDAFKRAAVKWGIGRDLYSMKNVWAPCTLYNDKFSDWAPAAEGIFRRALEGISPQREAPQELPTGPISDETRSWIESRLASRQLQTMDLCKAFDVTSLTALTYERMDDVKNWIRDNTKEAA